MSRPFWSGWFEPRRGSEKENESFPFFCLLMNPVVYIIYSEKLDKFYIGKSENFAQRLMIHNLDENEKWSKVGKPWTEYLVVECLSFKQAGTIERYIKAQKSRKYIIQLKQKPNYIENLLSRFTNEC